MKKYLAVFAVVLVLICSSLSVNAATDPFGTNYLKGAQWYAGYANKITVEENTSVVVEEITSSYCCAALDILPAVKAALGDDDSVTLELYVNIRGYYKSKPERFAQGSFIMRCPAVSTTDDAWNEEYKKSLNGDEPLFRRNNNNIMTSFDTDRASYPEGGWGGFPIIFTVTRNQVYSELTPKWEFCMDGIQLELGLEKISVRDVTLRKTTAPASTKTAAANNGASIATKTAAPMMSGSNASGSASNAQNNEQTPKPTEPTWLSQPIVNDVKMMYGMSAKVFGYIFLFGGAVYLLATFSVRTKRKIRTKR